MNPSRGLVIAACCAALLTGLCLASLDRNRGQVHHVVIVWLKAPGDEGARSRVLEACRSLEKIPGVLSVESGVVLPSDRAVVDSSFDLGLVITLQDRDALAAYAGHPLHVSLVEETLKPLVERYVVYDLLELP